MIETKVKFSVMDQGVFHFFYEDEILYCQADNGYTHLHLNDGRKFVICKSLRRTFKGLNPQLFIRISQSYVVNTTCIKSIDKNKKNVEMTDDSRLAFTAPLNTILQAISFLKL